MTSRRLARMTPEARSWYLAEIAYLAERNQTAAGKFATQLRAARQILSEYPNIGPPGFIPGTRRLVVGAYILIIRRRHGVPEVIDIHHGRQSDRKE